MRHSLGPIALVSVASLVAACSLVNAPDAVKAGKGAGGSGGSDATTTTTTSSTGGGGSTTSTTATTSTTTTTTTTTSTTSTTATGMAVCTPGTTQDCYSGPAGTEGVGTCTKGTQTCKDDGSDWGPCEGEVDPVAEDCNSFGDEDCNGKINDNCPLSVLLVAAVPNATYSADVAQKEMATGVFTKVDVFDATSGTPTLQNLQQYGAVMLFSDAQFQDPVTLGNNVADYWDGGGRVVVATFANTSGIGVQGKFGDPAAGYILIDPQGQEEPSDSLGQINEPNSPLMLGVSKLSATSAYRSSGGPINGATVVAQWASGKPLIVRGVVKGRNRVDLNMYPPSDTALPGAGFWTGNGAEIIRNALLFQ